MSLGRLAAVLALLSLVISLAHFTRPFAESDPDRYFHLALSRIEATAGTIHVLPQAADLDWARNFTDKEFLFHFLSRHAYALRGDEGVIALVPLLVMLILGALLAISAGWGAFWPAFGLELVLFFLSPHFYRRMLFLRPHILAILCFSGLLGGLLRGKPILACVSGLCFGLAYHSYFMPLLALALAFPFTAGSKAWRYAFIGGLAGLTAGILLNPYFPETLQTMFLVLNEASNPEFNRMLHSGNELLPLSAADFLSSYWLHCVLIVGGSLLLWLSPLRRSWRDPKHAHLFYLDALLLILLAAFLRSPRTNEYLVPVLVLFGAALYAAFPPKKSWLFASALLLVPYVGFAATSFSQIYGGILKGYDPLKPENAMIGMGQAELVAEGLAKIPKSAAGQKVFTCEWWMGAYVMYWRPDLKFVDVTAPEFLLLSNPEKMLARERLIEGQDPDIYTTIASKFESQYALCIHPKAILQMENNPNFARLFPAKFEDALSRINFPFVFAVRTGL